MQCFTGTVIHALNSHTLSIIAYSYVDVISLTPRMRFHCCCKKLALGFPGVWE